MASEQHTEEHNRPTGLRDITRFIRTLIAATLLILFVCFLWRRSIDDPSRQPVTTTETSSRLEKTLKISELSTYQVTYNGVAAIRNDADLLLYYAAYNAKVSIGIDMEKITVSLQTRQETQTDSGKGSHPDTEKNILVVTLPEVSLDKIIELLSCQIISGVTGPAINANVKELNDIKDLCAGNGVAVKTFEPQIKWEELTLNSDGLVPVVVQDYKTREVLMVAYMNKAAYLHTIKSGRMTYYSRSRKEQWIKGETSGHFQYVKEMKADCDKDTILAKVAQVGAACHTGNHSCFFNEIMKKEYDETNPLTVFESVSGVIKDRKVHPKEGSYTNYLFDKGIDKILKKLGEEATEIVIASKNPNPNEIKYEIADFLYHMMVLMAEKGVSWEEITEELAKR